MRNRAALGDLVEVVESFPVVTSRPDAYATPQVAGFR